MFLEMMCLASEETLKQLSHRITSAEIHALRAALIDGFPYEYESDTVDNFDDFVSVLRSKKQLEHLDNQKFLFDEYLLQYVCSEKYSEDLKLYVLLYYVSQGYLDVPESLSKISLKVLSKGLDTFNVEFLSRLEHIFNKIIYSTKNENVDEYDVYYYIYLTKLVLAKIDIDSDNDLLPLVISKLNNIIDENVRNSDFMLTDDCEDWKLLIGNLEFKKKLDVKLLDYLPDLVNGRIKDYEKLMYGSN